MQRFLDKTVIVTGGNSGIGRTAALKFAQEGARVAIVARSAEKSASAVAEIEAAGGVAAFFRADVSRSAEVADAVQDVVARFGRFHAAFNCSGYAGDARSFEALTEEHFDEVVKVNLYGVFHCMKHEVAHFLENGEGGVILNCASTSGLVGLLNYAQYSASKHAVIGLTKSAALDFAARGIRINAICPGGVGTTMLDDFLKANPAMLERVNRLHPIGRMARAEEVANLVLWLCSDESTNVIGQAWAVDGGYTAQ